MQYNYIDKTTSQNQTSKKSHFGEFSKTKPTVRFLDVASATSLAIFWYGWSSNQIAIKVIVTWEIQFALLDFTAIDIVLAIRRDPASSIAFVNTCHVGQDIKFHSFVGAKSFGK